MDIEIAKQIKEFEHEQYIKDLEQEYNQEEYVKELEDTYRD